MLVYIKSTFENDVDADVLEIKKGTLSTLDERIERFKRLLFRTEWLASNYYYAYKYKAPISDKTFLEELGEEDFKELKDLGYIKNNMILKSPFTDNGIYMNTILEELINNYPEDYNLPQDLNYLEYSLG